MAKFHSVYPHVLPDLNDWPIHKLSKDRAQFIEELKEEVIDKLLIKYEGKLNSVIAKTIYQEIKRCKENPWKVDPSNEIKFWKGLGNEFQANKLSINPDIKNHELAEKIINRYSEEILGKFRIKTFKFARKFLTRFFHRLFVAATDKKWILLPGGSRKRLYERIHLEGQIEKVRNLCMKGTLILVPTHISNIDSILLGYAIDGVAGLPAFSYGAGLNLYDLELIGYFADRLGAYKVDRRKKNPLYLETLKNMSKLSIERGVNSLFFPGGTRSRSGELESNLKMGLLGTLVEAQRSLFQEGKDEKIFIVPLTMSYNFVLEAKYLIEQHLSSTGREKYIKIKDQGKSHWKLLQFLWKLFSASSEIYLSFGEPMDIFGNKLDDDGNSYDQHKKMIDLKDYFTLNDSIITNTQRESIYTKKLADKIVESYQASNIILASHLVAFVAFKLFRKSNPNLAIYDLVNLNLTEFEISYDHFKNKVKLVWDQLLELNKQKKAAILESYRTLSIDEIIQKGINDLGIYHSVKPLTNDQDRIKSQDFKLLLYYHNRMKHYPLSFDIGEVKEQLQTVE